MITLFLLHIAHFAAERWRKNNMTMNEAFTVSSLIDALLILEDTGWGNTLIVNSDGLSFCGIKIENQYDGNVVVIK